MDMSMAKPGNPQVLVELIRRLFLEINTCIPGEIVYYDSTRQTATVRPCIRSVTIEQDGSKKTMSLPEIFLCPVWFPFSTTSGFSLTYPIVPKDQCLILFSQRSFDNWLSYGSIQNPAEKNVPRNHAYTDAICLVGLIPNVNAIPQFQMNGIEMRNKNRNSYDKVTDTTQEEHIFDPENETEVHEIRNIDGSIARHNSNTTIEKTDVSITQTTPIFEGNYETSHTMTIGEKKETISGNKIVSVGGNQEETISGNKIVSATINTNKGETHLEGPVQTSVEPGGALRAGLTASVGVPGGPTLEFVNGLLVRIA